MTRDVPCCGVGVLCRVMSCGIASCFIHFMPCYDSDMAVACRAVNGTSSVQTVELEFVLLGLRGCNESKNDLGAATTMS